MHTLGVFCGARSFTFTTRTNVFTDTCANASIRQATVAGAYNVLGGKPINMINPLTPTGAIGTAIKHPVPDRVKPSFVIFDILAL